MSYQVIGYKFKDDIVGWYNSFGDGSTDNKSEAHLYNINDVQSVAHECAWGGKENGRWCAVWGKS